MQITCRAALEDFVKSISKKAVEMAEDEDNAEIYTEGKEILCGDWIGKYVNENLQAEDDYGQIMIPDDLDEEQLTDICTEIVTRVFEMPQWTLWLYEAKKELTEYAKDFAKQLKTEWGQLFEDVSPDFDVIIHSDDKKDAKGQHDFTTAGNVAPTGIRLYSVYKPGKMDDYKQTARHEVIHYMLYWEGLQYADDSAMFWFFANLYDANPYKAKSEFETGMYELMQHIHGKLGNEGIKKYLTGIKEIGQEADEKARKRMIKSLMVSLGLTDEEKKGVTENVTGTL